MNSKKHRVLLVLGYPLLHNSSVTIQNRLIILGLNKLGYEVDVVCPKALNSSSSNDPSLADIFMLVHDVFEISPNKIYEFILKTVSKKDRSTNSETKTNALLTDYHERLRTPVKNFLANTYAFFEITGAAKLSLVDLNDIDSTKYSLVISSSDPKVSHIIAAKLLKKLSTKPRWIQYWGDPWLQDITLRGAWKKRIIRFLEKKLLSYADKIVYASPLTLEKQRELYPEYAEKMTYAHQATERVILTPKLVHSTRRTFVVSYVGDYNPRIRQLRPFVEAAMFFADVKFKIVGSGKLEGTIPENIELIQKRLPLDRVRELELETDVFFAVCNKKGTQIPAKIYYLAGYLNKPIIVALDGEYKESLKTFLERFDRYIVCDNETESIRKALMEALKHAEKGTTFELKDELKPETMVLRIIDGLKLE